MSMNNKKGPFFLNSIKLLQATVMHASRHLLIQYKSPLVLLENAVSKSAIFFKHNSHLVQLMSFHLFHLHLSYNPLLLHTKLKTYPLHKSFPPLFLYQLD